MNRSDILDRFNSPSQYQVPNFNLSLAYFGVHLGDAFGAGWEMRSREEILENWEEMDKGFYPRQPGHDQNHKPGMCTDDFEMTLGSLAAVMRDCNTENGLVEEWLKIYIENAEVKGARCGYGSIVKVAKLLTSDKVEENGSDSYLQQLHKNRTSQANKEPGNAALMRQLPFMIEGRYDLVEKNVLATHPNTKALYASSALFAMWCFQPIDFYNSLFKKIKNHPYFKYDEEKIVEMQKRLKLIDKLPPIPKDDNKLSNLDEDALKLLLSLAPLDQPAKYAKPLNGGTGLSAKAEHTLYCAYYLIKNMDSTDAYGNLKRCIAIGGDVDTLAAIVMPYVLRNKINSRDELISAFPEWVFTDIEVPPKHRFVYNFGS